jgi:hypothetical protein
MGERKLSLRVARMELQFALVKGDRQDVEIAEKKLEHALVEAEKRRRTRKTETEKKRSLGREP